MPSRSRASSPQQQLCESCKKLEDLVRQWRLCRNDDTDFEDPLECCLHDSYTKVEENAITGCPACRAIRRSLLQHQVTWKAVRELAKFTGPVYAKLSPKSEPFGSDFALDVTAHGQTENGSEDQRSVRFLCTDEGDVGPRDLPKKSEDNEIIRQIQSWMDCCYQDHNKCSNLRWSQKNPTNLIQILPEDKLRLVEPPKSRLLKYSALSYSWGERDSLSVDEVSQIEHAKTRRQSVPGDWKANIETRRNRFSLSDLPLAMRDAIRLSRRLGIEYIWIDQVCIGDAENWNHEASKMHEVYGNAHVTICACSTEKATDGLFASQRSAWDYPESPCMIEGLRLLEYDMSLKEVRLNAPIFKRAWILQEERLSPRTIYWCSQRVYWSCLHSAKTEVTRHDADGRSTPEPFERHVSAPTLLPPQSFMEMRWKGETNRLHSEWLDLVQDFAKRAIYDPTDRFPAMSGLAAQYLQAFTYDDQVIERQEYLAGLWRDTFAHDLTWSVETARAPFSKHSYAPRWSWASLPSETLVKTKHHFQSSPYFELKEPSRVKKKDGAFEVVKRGGKIDAVRVKGRMRRFAAKHSITVDWRDIVKSEDNDKEFRLDKFGMTNVVAKHIERGRILSYEANKEEVVAQLDYAEDYGAMKDLWCLEVGKSSMLILVKANKQRKTGVPSFVRIGAGHGFRENFFNDNIAVKELDLVARQGPLEQQHLSSALQVFTCLLLVVILGYGGAATLL